MHQHPCRKTFAELKDIICSPNVKLNQQCWCFTHEKYCERGCQPNDNCDLEFGAFGSPCTESLPVIIRFSHPIIIDGIGVSLTQGLDILGRMLGCRG